MVEILQYGPATGRQMGKIKLNLLNREKGFIRIEIPWILLYLLLRS